MLEYYTPWKIWTIRYLRTRRNTSLFAKAMLLLHPLSAGLSGAAWTDASKASTISAPYVTAPCGPGRLFPYWKKRGVGTLGVDLSDEMVEAARLRKIDLDIPGEVIKADAFCLHDVLSEKPDLVASIRFFYYFDRPQRIQLLRSLASTARKYLLLQYKTMSTLKGRRTFTRSRNKKYAKKFCC